MRSRSGVAGRAVRRHIDNFQALLRRATDAATAVRMGRALATYWHMGNCHNEGLSWMEQIAALRNASPHERAVA